MLRVILADDNDEFRDWLRSMVLESKEIEIVGEADSGAKALELAKQFRPDVMIADVFMGDLTGLDVSRELRESSPETQCILISADEEEIYRTLAAEAGAVEWIPKARLSLRAIIDAIESNE